MNILWRSYVTSIDLAFYKLSVGIVNHGIAIRFGPKFFSFSHNILRLIHVILLQTLILSTSDL